MIKSFLLVAYFYTILPLLIGTAISLLFSYRPSLSFVYVFGYITHLSLFHLVVLLAKYHSISFMQFVTAYRITTRIIAIVAILIIILFSKIHATIFSFSLNNKKYSYGIFLLTVAIILISVLFLTPHAQDQTPEFARIALINNRINSNIAPVKSIGTTVFPYCGDLFLFYVFGSAIAGIDVTVLIHIIMPIVLIPFFVGCYLLIARILLPDKKQFPFVFLVILFYILMLPLEAHIAFAPYRNIWNGTTLAASCLLPLFVASCLKIIRAIASKKATLSVCVLVRSIASLAFIIFTINLCVSFGYVICSLFLLASLIIISHILIRQKR